MPSVTELSGYVLEPIREGADFTLYRGRQHGNPSPVLALALAAEQPSPQGLRRLEHEYSLAAELDPAWAARPLALTRHEGRTILVLEDPGGELLEWVHCHIARQPTPPGERASVPEPVSSLTMKLLAKNPEERYQTASGLEAD